MTSATPPASSAASPELHRDKDKPSGPSPVPGGMPQFGRFRLDDFQRSDGAGHTAVGQCSRFRVTNFIPWASASGSEAQASVAKEEKKPPSSAKGSFGVMHMDFEASLPQQTSSSVVTAKKGSLLQEVDVQPAGAQTNGAQTVDFSQFPDESRWELKRIYELLQTQAPEVTVQVLSAAVLSWPSVGPTSFLSHLSELFPRPHPPTPPPGKNETQPKRKRGRPRKEPATSVYPNHKKLLATETQTCTRCLKPFNPAWRPTPASDPSSEATCAVRHSYTDFTTGLVLCVPAKRRKDAHPTWRWKCCGREIQSSAEEAQQWPNKEDDRTGGWCFVGKHTTEEGVRDMLGLKPGKGGKKIGDAVEVTIAPEPAGKKRKVEKKAEVIGNAPAEPTPPKRKRGRPPKGPNNAPKPQTAVETQPETTHAEETTAIDPKVVSNASTNFWGSSFPTSSASDINPVDLSLLVAASSALEDAHGGSLEQQEPEPMQPEPVKRGRGRPRGSKKKKVPEPEPQPEPAVEVGVTVDELRRREEEAQHVLAESGGGWFGEGEPGWPSY